VDPDAAAAVAVRVLRLAGETGVRLHNMNLNFYRAQLVFPSGATISVFVPDGEADVDQLADQLGLAADDGTDSNYRRAGTVDGVDVDLWTTRQTNLRCACGAACGHSSETGGSR
jgi:hypothetical protein